MKIAGLKIAGEGVILIKPLYLILMKNNIGNIKQCKTLIKHGCVSVNHSIEYNSDRIIFKDDEVFVNNCKINSSPFVYYMINKPKGYICASKDQYYRCISDLIDRDDCFCIGRLDIDTTGFVFMTNDKSLSKSLSHPSFNKIKKYYVTLLKKIDYTYIDLFKQGIIIDRDIQCKKALLEIIDNYHCYVSLTEGRYHQIKKMFLSCGNKVIDLKRISYCGIDLDESLQLGEYRSLKDEELLILFDK